MIRPTFFILAVLTFESVSVTPTTNSAGPATRPAHIESAQSALENWVSRLRGKTEKQIVQEFGDGCERSTWQSGDQQGLQLRYQFGSKSKLDLLFSDGRVV